MGAGAIIVTGDGGFQVRVLVPPLVGRAVEGGLVFAVLAPPSGPRLFSAFGADWHIPMEREEIRGQE